MSRPGSDRELSAPAGAHQLDEPALAAYLEEQIPDFTGPCTIQQFLGGQSNPTYRLDTQTGQYVLRRQPPGELLKSAHAVDREYRVIAALRDSEAALAKAQQLAKIGNWRWSVEHDELLDCSEEFARIHGVGLDHTMWEPQMSALEEAFCVLRYDMLGHGRSEARPAGVRPPFRPPCARRSARTAGSGSTTATRRLKKTRPSTRTRCLTSSSTMKSCLTKKQNRKQPSRRSNSPS